MHRTAARTHSPRVSVLVAVKQAEDFLPGCLESLLEQSISSDIEVLVIESEPRGREASVIEDFVARFPAGRLRNLLATRPGLYAAWNTGIRSAGGDLLMNLNADDRLRADAVETLTRSFDQHPDVALVYGDSLITTVPNETFVRNSSGGRRFGWPEYSHKRLLLQCICGPHPMWRRRLHDELGYFDESFQIAGDYDMWLRVAAVHPLLRVDEAIGLYYDNPRGLSADASQLAEESRRIKRTYFRDP